MNRTVFRVVALIAIVTLAACSSSMEQTPLPPDDSTQAAGQMPDGSAPGPFSSSNSDSDSDSDSDAPVSGTTPAAGASSPQLPFSQGAQAPAKASASKSSPAPAAPLLAAGASGQPAARALCRHPALPGQRACDAIVRTDVGGAAPNGYHGELFGRAFATAANRLASCGKWSPYCPAYLQAAYGLTGAAKSRGRNVTVALVDAYGYRAAEHDLAVYRAGMRLPPCSSKSGCFKVVNQSGRTSPLPPPNTDSSNDWRGEEALDIEMVSAICPNCKILLVQANSNRNSDLGAAVNAAVALHAKVVSNSYDSPETNGSDAAYSHAGVAIVASAGDAGTGAEQPCSYASVVCVGGTTLKPSSSARGWNERAWSETGSGCSAKVSKPTWQTDKGCTRRSEVDVSAVADPNTGVAIYSSVLGGWTWMGGTSASAPIVAAVFALGSSSAWQNAPQWIWHRGSSKAFNDVVQGSNGNGCAVPYICHAGPGYDGPTGWGTPNGTAGL